jgi:arylsulfatase A-like enzyme
MDNIHSPSRNNQRKPQNRTLSVLLVSLTFALALPGSGTTQNAVADFDGNGTVAFDDFLLFAEAFGTTNAIYDLDIDGTVGFGDFLLFVEAFGNTSADVLPPNILLIIADDMGLDATPGYNFGDTKPTMPVLDSLASIGVTYDNVWSAPLCSPTRATILTGRYGFRTNVITVDNAISETETSIQSYLREQAPTYADAIIGKWHLSGARAEADAPNRLGISHYAGFLTGSLSDYWDWPLTINGATTDSQGYATTVFTDLAIDWVSSRQDQPWFLWLAYTAPHTPFHLPPDSLHTRSNLSGETGDIDSRPRPYYLAALEALDTEMGRLLRNVDTENTIVIFIGDNGTPARAVQEPVDRMRAKGSIYEGGIHVPMIVAGKGVTRHGEREDALINTTDLFATIVDLTGAGTDLIHDSVSFRSTLTSAGTGRRTFAYSEIENDGISQWAIRNERYKLVSDETGRQELFDLQSDPFELTELLSSGSDSTATARTELEATLSQLRN